jgi:gamma-glutamyl hercynylcysteine S-oxide synthase
MKYYTMELVSKLRADAAGFGSEPLLVLHGEHIINLENGYIPLLVDFTFEDKAAKGLRKRKASDKPEPPIYFSVLEVVRDNQILFLRGPSGGGKTTFAKHLCFRLATTDLNDARPVIRNNFGLVHEESWDAANIAPCYFRVESPQTLKSLINNTIPSLLKYVDTKNGDESEERLGLLIIIDAIEKAGDEVLALLPGLVTLVEGLDCVRLLFLSDTSISKRWTLPSAVVRHNILPLFETQRKDAVSRFTGVESSQIIIGTGTAAANPTIFALALQAKHPGEQTEEVLDSWLSIVIPDPSSAEDLALEAFKGIDSKHLSQQGTGPTLSSLNAVQELLAARHLATLPTDAAINLFRHDPLGTQTIISSVLIRLSLSGKSYVLAERLISGTTTLSQQGALLVASLGKESKIMHKQLAAKMLDIINQGALSVSEREEAGRVLARLGDPRDLTELADVPNGTFVFGSNSHPNSQPQGQITLNDFRIGVYPVVNRDYLLFIQETGREWLSPDGQYPERSNAPATDLTWNDARAYCKWLTHRWRLSKKISPDEHVRLPTEPEWERASNGDQNQANAASPIYPWGREWKDDASNFEETGFNTTCTVGLFPRGRSPYGCYDMAGQVWEWCTTLWGEDMSTPFFSYPWRDDGRERLDAPESVRRVLRGGCFSSGRLKACGTYRGSLEPIGFWRGNGFRVVVAK